jgi:3-oxoacyl-[acyl-carrier protein] reductase
MATAEGMEGKRVLVTGASSGIGAEVARQFLADGAWVGVHYCNDKAGAERVAGGESSGRAHIFQADFSESQQVHHLWDEFISWAGSGDVLVNNAADPVRPMPLDQFCEATWDRAFQINVKAPVILSRLAMAGMKEKGWGRVINISSVGVKFGGGATTAHYSASKAALEAVTRSLAKEGAAHNVLVNAVQAGVTATPLHAKIGRQDLSGRAELIPLKRVAQPSEIAHVVLFLASEGSSFVTGGIVPVAGGE